MPKVLLLLVVVLGGLPFLFAMADQGLPDAQGGSGPRIQAFWALFALGGAIIALAAWAEYRTSRERLEEDRRRQETERLRWLRSDIESRFAEATRNLDEPSFARLASVLRLALVAESDDLDATGLTDLRPVVTKLLASVTSDELLLEPRTDNEAVDHDDQDAPTAADQLIDRQSKHAERIRALGDKPVEAATRAEALRYLISRRDGGSVLIRDSVIANATVDATELTAANTPAGLRVEGTTFDHVDFVSVDLGGVEFVDCAFDTVRFHGCKRPGKFVDSNRGVGCYEEEGEPFLPDHLKTSNFSGQTTRLIEAGGGRRMQRSS